MNNKQIELLQLIATINRQVDFTSDISIYIKCENDNLTTIELIELINKTTQRSLENINKLIKLINKYNIVVSMYTIMGYMPVKIIDLQIYKDVLLLDSKKIKTNKDIIHNYLDSRIFIKEYLMKLSFELMYNKNLQ
jgi:hypothetical protein